MANSLPQSPEELKSWLQQLDEILYKKAIELAKQCYKTFLEKLDDAMTKHRDSGLRIEHCRAVWYQTRLGSIKIKRRQYRNKEGSYRYLLDELIGMRQYRHMTTSVQEIALDMASSMPYRRCAEVLHKASAINLPHQTIWRLVQKVADPYLRKTEQQLNWFLETGEIPECEMKAVSRLFMEADGVMISLQRERQRKTEVKVGIAYEGWEKIGKDRYRTVNKTAYAAIAGEQSFWAGMNLKLQGKYDLSCIKDTIVGGDGARWVKEGSDYVNGRFQLDRYHLNRELTMALGNDKKTKGRIWHACKCGDVKTVLRLMSEAMKEARGDKLQRMVKAYHYLQGNSTGLTDYRLTLGEEGKGLRRTGAMEGNVDKLIARRMKNQGMSWTIQGIRRLLCVRFLVLEKKLAGWLAVCDATKYQTNVPRKEIRRIVNRLSMSRPDDWLQANIPALYGPNNLNPWVIALKNITEASRI